MDGVFPNSPSQETAADQVRRKLRGGSVPCSAEAAVVIGEAKMWGVELGSG